MIEDYVDVEAIKIKSNNRLNIDVKAFKCKQDKKSDWKLNVDVEASK